MLSTFCLVALHLTCANKAVVADDRFVALSSLKVHEWGVWRIRDGKVDHLAELAAEMPAFVNRAPAGPPSLTPRPMPQVADKPVIYLYADRPTRAQITVEMPGGQPWFFSPEGVAGITDAPESRTVRWNVQVLPPGSEEEKKVSMPAVPPAHWWTFLRKVPASVVVPVGRTSGERFLFYDGPVPFQSAWAIKDGVPFHSASARGPSETAWTSGGSGPTRVVQKGARREQVRLAGIPELRQELRAALTTQGLTGLEADALLETWKGDLFGGDAPRSLWLLSRQDYDRMLPLDIQPLPAELVRVGLVIQLAR